MGAGALLNNKGQISIYLLLLIIVIFAIAITYDIYNAPIEGLSDRSASAATDLRSQAQQFLQGCLQETASTAVSLVGYQGGWAYPQSAVKSVPYEGFNIGVAVLYGVNVFPSTKTVEKQISYYVSRHIDDCARKLDPLRLQGAEIRVGQAQASTTIGLNSVTVRLRYPASIKTLDRTYSLSEVATTLPVQLGTILNDVERVMESQAQDPHFLATDAMSKLPYESKIVMIDKNTKLYSFIDNNSMLFNQPYVFWTIMKNADNLAPHIIDPGIIEARSRGLKRISALDFEKDEVRFGSGDKRFLVDPVTGILTINAGPGRYEVPVSVIDSVGNTNLKTIIIKVN